MQFRFGIEYFAADGGESYYPVIPEGLQSALADMQILHHFLAGQVALISYGRSVFLTHGNHAFVGCPELSGQFLELGGLFRYQVFHIAMP